MTKDDIIRMDWVAFTESLEAFAALVAAAEREACAKLCESHVRYPSRLHFATAIRARRTTTRRRTHD